MRNLKLFAIASIILLVASSSFAVSAERGEFIVLGRDQDGELSDEKVTLSVEPGVTTETQAMLQSGTEMLVLDKREVEGAIYYILSTVGPEGGITGWVTEDYIYELTERPVY